MDELLTKLNPDYTKLKRYVINSTARELSNLSAPCYYPKTKRTYYELINILKVTDKDFKAFVKRNYKGTKAEKWNLWKDPGTNLLILVLHLFLMKKDKPAYSTTMVYYMIIQYSRLMHKQMKYCDEDAFKYTLDNLTRTHLFFREKTIPNSLFYLSKAMQTNFTSDIAAWNKDGIIAFIGSARHRISQSVKSFAQSYYRNKQQGLSIKTQNDEQDDEANRYQYKVLERGQKIVDQVSKKITIYKLVDKKAFEEAKKISKVKSSIAVLVAQALTNEKNFNNIKMTLQVFIKEVKNVDMICGSVYYEYVKKLMALKRTNSQLYFKAQINILVIDILKDIKLYDVYDKYTSQTQFIINSFLAFYLTLILRDSLC